MRGAKLDPRSAREVHRLCLDVVLLDGEQDAAPSLSDMARRAQALLDGPLKPRRKIARPRSPGKTRDERRDERRDQTAAIREACAKRAGGKCETCGTEESAAYPLQMHHLLPGRGRRREQQAVENCVMVCMWCHEFGHGRILYVGPGLLAWADKHGYRAAYNNVRRRMDKALIADPTWPRDEDEVRRLGPARSPSGAPTDPGRTT